MLKAKVCFESLLFWGTYQNAPRELSANMDGSHSELISDFFQIHDYLKEIMLDYLDESSLKSTLLTLLHLDVVWQFC